MEKTLVGKSVFNVSSVQVTLRFDDGMGVMLPLTPYQGAKVIELLGIVIDEKTGDISHYTDKKLDEIINGG